jgi:acetyl esterase/lipase
MKKLARLFSCVSAFFGVLTILKLPPGWMSGVLWLPRLWAGAWAPFLAIIGGVGVLFSWVYKDRKAILPGLLGTALGVRYTLKVTAPHDHFAQVFGSKWEERIPVDLLKRLPAKRYRLVQPASPFVPGQRNVMIGTSGILDYPLLCDIWEPPLGVPSTGLAIIYLHGGLWQAADKDFLTQPLFRRLVSQGHVVMDVAYSLAPEADLDCMLGDVKKAIVWMKKHSGEYKVNPNRIVLMGVSGGAHLALLAAYAPEHPAFQDRNSNIDMSVRAVVSISGICDLRAYYDEYGRMNPRQPEYSTQITDDLRPRIFDKTWLDKFLTRSRAFPAYRHANLPGGPLLLVYLLGGTLEEVPEAYRLGSPIVYVGAHRPPTLLIHGEDDFIVNVSQSRRLQQVLRDAGVVSIYIEYPDTVHAFNQYFGVSERVAPAAQSATFDIERFLALMV